MMNLSPGWKKTRHSMQSKQNGDQNLLSGQDIYRIQTKKVRKLFKKYFKIFIVSKS